MALYKGTTKLSGVGSGFAPLNQGNNGDVLKKSQFGYEWGEENTKTFPLSGTGSSVEVLAEAQDIVDFFLSGGMPLINWGDCIWVLVSSDSRGTPKSLWFKRNVPQFNVFGGSATALLTDELKIEYNGTTASGVFHFNGNYYTKFLNTDTDYLIPYTPQYDGSPATKKYVDDIVGDIETLLNNI